MGKRIVTKTLKLEGLTCTSCETRIENKLNKINGIIDVEVSYVTQILSVTYNEEKISLEEIKITIKKLDYGIEEDFTNTKVKKGKESYNQIIIIGIILLGGYLIIKNTIGFNFIPEINPSMGYGVLFVIGLLTSIHCVAMCGGINLSVCVSYKSNQVRKSNNGLSKFLPSLMYNAGRVISYTIIGGIVGALGSVFSISNTGSAFISILAGVFMVIMGLNMLNIFPWLRKLNPHMPKVFAKKINNKKKNKGPFVVGLLNGLMPCGPLQAMQIYALGTGSILGGALSMFIFSLGTVPLLFAFGALGSLLSSKFTKNMIKVSAVLVIILGFVMLNRGFAFTGITLNTYAADSGSDTTTNTTTINDNIQEITTTLESGSFTPITVQEGIPVKWTIIADDNSLNGCNNVIIIPEYDIRQELVEGENVIEFTPTETGAFGYSCWMGMIRSSITVVSDLQNNEETDDTENSTDVDNTGLPSGCCGI